MFKSHIINEETVQWDVTKEGNMASKEREKGADEEANLEER